ncbi:hypothetical protein V1505DRAFT_378386 [Lipomyces doorenjongii]
MLILFRLIVLIRVVQSFTTTMLPSPPPPNVYILTDISNEPDDAQSLVRLLLYSNELKIHGIAASTSVWLNRTTCPDCIHFIINAYGKVVDSLLVHSSDYPTASDLHALVTTGSTTYGTLVLDEPPSAAVSHLIATVDGLSPNESLWVQCWGGASILAHALSIITSLRSSEDVNIFISKLRVYSISDQDNAGSWIRMHFPQLFYIVSLHGWNQYGLATWSGISGEKLYKFDNGGPDGTIVSDEWLRENIQIGRFGGTAYPNKAFIMEGDSPAFLYLVQNGLGVQERPEWGSWGGRYVNAEQSGCTKVYTDTADTVIVGEREYKSNQATIWRWRSAFQSDFAARMRWTMAGSYGAANHPPIVVVNGTESVAPIIVRLCKNEDDVVVDASQSNDPDGDDIFFKWTQYHEAPATRWSAQKEVLTIGITELATGIVRLTVPKWEEQGQKSVFNVLAQEFHVILEVTDSGEPAMRRYKRVIIERTGENCGIVHDEL